MKSEAILESSNRALKQSQIVDYIKEKIVSSELGSNARLPTRQNLAAQFGVSSVTIQRGLDRLRDEGFVVARGRLGSFVVDSPPHLCRYALVLPCEPSGEASVRPPSGHLAPSTRFMDAMAQVALKYAGDRKPKIVSYAGADRELKTKSFQRLASDIRAHRLAGIIFLHPYSSYTPELLQGSGIPCIANASSLGLPGMPVFHIDTEAFISRALDFMAERRRKRIGLIGIAHLEATLVDYFHRAAAARGLETGPHAVIGLDPLQPHWARSAALMMMNQEPSRRPDGLIISDDHFVPAASQGILDCRVSVPTQVEILGLCNFTTTTPEAVLIKHLGFDLSEILRTCIRLLDAQRRGEQFPAVTRIAPVFEPKPSFVISPPERTF